ncbi:MAG: cytochrome c oxidase subunit 3 [Acidimicrobiales bacterium]
MTATSTSTSATISPSPSAPASEVDAAAGVLPTLPPAPDRRRPNVILVGTLFVIAGGVMLLGGLLAGYFSARQVAQAANQEWPPKEVAIPNVQLFLAYLTLLMSSFTAQWAVSAIAGRDRRSMYVAIGLTLMLGLAFVNALSFSWGQLGLEAGANRYANTVYALTVTHLLVVIVAMVGMVVMGFRAFGGQFSPRDRELVVAAAAFWHFAVAAGVVIWYCLWFLEGGP